MLLSRYLGNKAVLLDEILKVTATRCQPGDRVLDAFSGSLAVSMAYKRSGYRVSANDINSLSAAFGRAYLENCAVPTCPLDDLVLKRRARVLRAESDARMRALDGLDGFDFLADDESRTLYRDLLAGLLHLQLVDEETLPAGDARTDFFDAYCPEGRFSAFRSSRGREGRRRFLTAENARRLDLVVSQLRSWRRRQALPESTHWLFVSVACHALEKVANTQGTYHDFPRDVWDSRAFKPLTLVPPPLDDVLTGPGGHVVGQEDSVAFAAKAGPHRLVYVDPPYNFRQYTAYYFLPNLVARYPDLEGPDDYFAALTFVRGQNPSDDFTSDFCSSSKFIAAMRDLLVASDVDSVLVSYFTGKNHWSDFNSERSNAGLEILSALLQEETFEPGSLTITEVPRKNYASYGGYRARAVHELLLLADKKPGSQGPRRDTSVPTVSPSPSQPSQRGLTAREPPGHCHTPSVRSPKAIREGGSMGQGGSRRSGGTGLAGVGAADGVLAIDCMINGTVRGRAGGSAGVGVLRRSDDRVVVIADGTLLASCDPRDPTTAVLHACLGQGFDYVGNVTVDEKGATLIDVATTR